MTPDAERRPARGDRTAQRAGQPAATVTDRSDIAGQARGAIAVVLAVVILLVLVSLATNVPEPAALLLGVLS